MTADTIDDSPLSEDAERICKKRYYQKDTEGNLTEDWKGLVTRVVDNVCKKEDDKFKKRVFDLIYNTKFLPNSPCLVNAGNKISGLMACFVAPEVEDSWEDMTKNIKTFGDIARRGGGCGISFAKIRPEGDPVFGSTHTKACGPIEHMRMISEVMGSITQSGFRSMAMLGSLRVDHPDIEKFILCKQKERALKTLLKEDIFNQYDQINSSINEQLQIILDKFIHNFNISVLVNDDFMNKVKNDEEYDLIFNEKIYKTIKARKIFKMIVENAWKNGDPGLLFYDAMNDGPYKYSKQEINCTNPCVTGDSIVITRDGPQKIKDIVGKHTEVLSYVDAGGIVLGHNPWQWQTTEGSFKTKENAQVLCIETNTSKITCTPDHKILTDSGWKEGKDIKKGQQILCNPSGLGVSHGLENTRREKWAGFGAEIQKMAQEEQDSREATEEVVSGRVWPEENSFYDLNYWVDILTIKEIFYQRETSSTWKKCSNPEDQGITLRECARQEESVLSLDTESRASQENPPIQLRLVCITDCGKSIFAEFLRVDNGDVLGFATCKLEDGSPRLYSPERTDLSARLLHLLQKWQTEEDYRSEEQVDNGITRIQSGVVSQGITNTNRIGYRYITICSKGDEFYKRNSTSLEKIVRITEAKPQDVYDLTTDHESHNFVANGVVVHNCGEEPMPPHSACDLGSIDVSKFYDEETKEVNWNALKKTIHICIRFLDNVIDTNKFPTDEFKKWAKENRPIGLGIMGWADLLIKLKTSYGSSKSIKLAEKLSCFFINESHKASVKLAKDRGTPKCCKFDKLEHRRNITLTSIAPTGSISLIAGCSSSIEPIYSPVVYISNNTGVFEQKHNDADKSYFRCVLDPKNQCREVSWEEHVKMQAAFQQHIDAGTSKTVNMKNNATTEDIYNAYMLAWNTKCKGITVYRDGSKSTQVLMSSKHGSKFAKNNALSRPKKVEADIYRTHVKHFEWHVIVGKVNDEPYEIFAVNGSHKLPLKGQIIRNKSRDYSLVSEDGKELIIENIVEEEKDIDPEISVETRRFSLMLRHGIHPKYIVSQIDKSTAVINSFAKAGGRILKKYINTDDAMICPICYKEGKGKGKIVFDSGCVKCEICKNAVCG